MAFALPLLEHIDPHRREGGDRMGPRGRAVLRARLARVLVEHVSGDLARTAPRRPARGVPPNDLFAKHFAAAFVTVLDWWVESRSALPPAEVERIFRALVLPGLAPLLDAEGAE